MTSFIDWFRSFRRHAENGRDACDGFSQLLFQSGLAQWNPDVNAPRPALVVGVATWSAYDMLLLDRLSESVADGAAAGTNLLVVDVDAPGAVEQLHGDATSSGEVFHTPVLASWSGGRLTAVAEGAAARRHLADLFGFREDIVDTVRSMISDSTSVVT